MSSAPKYIILFFIILATFGYGMMSQAWGLFPKNAIEKAYWEIYAKPKSVYNILVQEGFDSKQKGFDPKKDWFPQGASREGASVNIGEDIRKIGTDTIETNLYKLNIRKISLTENNKDQISTELSEGRDGGIDNLGNDIILSSAKGSLFHLDKELELEPLSISIPFSRKKFKNYTKGTKYTKATKQRVPVTVVWFGVKDILVIEESNSRFRLLASYHHWNSQGKCYTLRVSQTVLNKSAFKNNSIDNASWENIYETEPCLNLKDKAHPFAGHEAGGRIVKKSDRSILLSVGHHAFDGIGDISLPQDSTNSYGKTVNINLETGQSKIYTIGHRNPQGLYIDYRGRIWSTEHGPRGGDELNLIEKGNNYGWPKVTYGTCYSFNQVYAEKCTEHDWPLSEKDGSHMGFVRPTFAWTPSIGISQLIGIEENLFKLWKDDLLISSLKEGTLFRTRIRKGRAVLSEPIKIGVRIRDLVEIKSGQIVLKTDSGKLFFLSPINGNGHV